MTTPQTPIGVNLFITQCVHGVDLRFTPRCYLCRPEPDAQRAFIESADTARPGLDEGCTCEPEHVWPCALIPRCDEPGCERETTCGWPSPTGYRRTCGKHYRARLAGDRP